MPELITLKHKISARGIKAPILYVIDSIES